MFPLRHFHTRFDEQIKAVCMIDSGVAAPIVCADRADPAHAVMMKVIRLITNKKAIFLCIPFSILEYFIVYILGKNQ